MLAKIQIINFRNIKKGLLELDEKLNLIYGNNAAGKTNILEAIYYLSHNKSFKKTALNDIICHKKNFFNISAIINNTRIQIHKQNNKKQKITCNHKQIKHTLDLVNIIPVQLICPDKGFIVGSTPKNKRYYLNWGVFHMQKSNGVVLKDYQKTYKQINELLLRKNNKQKNELRIWFALLAKQTTAIHLLRKTYINALKTILAENEISDYLKKALPISRHFNFTLTSGWSKQIAIENPKNVYQYLLNNLDKIINQKQLFYGVHKADIIFKKNDRLDKNLSRGEQKILSFIFWLLQIILLKQNQKKVLLLIDDIHSELDKENFNILLKLLQKINIQTILTSTNKKILDKNYKAKIFKITDGAIKLLN